MRASGILMPIFSLSTKYGIGTFGKEAYGFVDFLKEAGQSYWQILPLNPTCFGDSPYQSPSSYAGNPYFIDLDILCKEGWLNESDYVNIDWGSSEKIDYALLYQKRYAVLRKAYNRFCGNEPADFNEFYKENHIWLDNFALFTAIKNAHGGKPWNEWEDSLRFRKEKALSEATRLYADEIAFQITLQYWFSKQWQALKQYANENGIKIIGDIPIYVAFDSADVWGEPKQFALDNDYVPIEVAGCPPDAFTDDGQLWGNPLYNWEYMENSTPKYDWWCRRIAYNLNVYDVIRIDHFRGFEAYYAIPFGSENAVKGVWRKGPYIEFFNHLSSVFGRLPIIAEDLGFLTKEVKVMLEKSGFPGMKVLQFAFDSNSDSDYLPHNIPRNSIVYTGTHDNDTTVGWAKALSKADLDFAKRYMNVKENEAINWALIRTAYMSNATIAVIPFGDFLGLDSDYRINTPSTLGENWTVRIDSGCANSWLAKIIYDMTKLYRRLPIKLKNEEIDLDTVD